jgi:hypothetical protein
VIANVDRWHSECQEGKHSTWHDFRNTLTKCWIRTPDFHQELKMSPLRGSKPRMGRPPIRKSERRRHVIPLRLDDAELRALDTRAAQLEVSRSQFIRDAVMGALGRPLSRGAGGRAR